MEAQIERFAPGFRERIIARNVAGPAELERDDANLVHGDVGGGSYKLSQSSSAPPSASPVPHAAQGAVPRQRARSRGGARRAGRRRGARGAPSLA
jgi:phytoene dehydrogenase-like protein